MKRFLPAGKPEARKFFIPFPAEHKGSAGFRMFPEKALSCYFLPLFLKNGKFPLTLYYFFRTIQSEQVLFLDLYTPGAFAVKAPLFYNKFIQAALWISCDSAEEKNNFAAISFLCSV